MFRRDTIIELVLPTEKGDKVLQTVFPSDEAWIKRHKTRFVQITDLGRGNTTHKAMMAEEADLALVNSLLPEDEKDKFDGAEAIILCEQLATCNIVEVSKQGSYYDVTVQTVLGETKHTLKIPSHKDLKRRNELSSKFISGRYNSSSLHTMLAPSKELYNQLFEGAEGYEPADLNTIPIVHKYKVIDAISTDINDLKTKANGEDPLV